MVASLVVQCRWFCITYMCSIYLKNIYTNPCISVTFKLTVTVLLYILKLKAIWNILQVKELGVVMGSCSCLSADLAKIFDVYWYLGAPNVVPPHWPDVFATQYNSTSPMSLSLNNTRAMVYLSVSHRGQLLYPVYLSISHRPLLYRVYISISHWQLLYPIIRSIYRSVTDCYYIRLTLRLPMEISRDIS